ncbi:MAG TPA: hypothetical protein VF025_13450 [Gaiellaceae bacterium]
MKLAALAWVARWAAQELAVFVSRRWGRPGPSPRESPSRPGWMS